MGLIFLWGEGVEGDQEGKHPNNNNKSNLEIKVLRNEITKKKLKPKYFYDNRVGLGMIFERYCERIKIPSTRINDINWNFSTNKNFCLSYVFVLEYFLFIPRLRASCFFCCCSLFNVVKTFLLLFGHDVKFLYF